MFVWQKEKIDKWRSGKKKSTTYIMNQQYSNLLVSGTLCTLKNYWGFQKLCLCRFYLLLFTVLEIKNGKTLKICINWK